MAKTLGAGLKKPRVPKRITSSVEPKGWVYVLGAEDGHAIKIGETRGTLRKRIHDVNKMQMTEDVYHLLAAVRGSRSDEEQLKKAVERKLGAGVLKKGSQTEYFDPCDRLVCWVNWLRGMAFVASSLDDQDVAEPPHLEYWIPDGNLRCVPVAEGDDDTLFDPLQQLQGPLAGTYWQFLRDPTVAIQDYFTDPPIVGAAAFAMGGIDLDVASHKMAQKRLIDNLPPELVPRDYFTKVRSAFDNEWNGNVWLNPPYGENEQWFCRYMEEADSGRCAQLCMISPVHAFNTKQALPFMARVDAMVILSPTPEFLNPGDPTAKGTNLPHVVVYCGPRQREFLAAFEPFGIRAMLVL